jgi:hypothetical protein
MMTRHDVLRLLTMTREQATAAGDAGDWDCVQAAYRRASRCSLVDRVLAELPDPRQQSEVA